MTIEVSHNTLPAQRKSFLVAKTLFKDNVQKKKEKSEKKHTKKMFYKTNVI
jgi:hypothetical protein